MLNHSHTINNIPPVGAQHAVPDLNIDTKCRMINAECKTGNSGKMPILAGKVVLRKDK